MFSEADAEAPPDSDGQVGDSPTAIGDSPATAQGAAANVNSSVLTMQTLQTAIEFATVSTACPLRLLVLFLRNHPKACELQAMD